MVGVRLEDVYHNVYERAMDISTVQVKEGILLSCLIGDLLSSSVPDDEKDSYPMRNMHSIHIGIKPHIHGRQR